MSAFWSGFVIVITLGNIIGAIWLLFATARRSPGEGDTTGHVWDDDLEELNNPLPRWWLYLFVGTVIFALGYLVLYPGLGNFKGTLGWTQVDQHAQERAAMEARQQQTFAQFDGMDIPTLATNQTARQIGQRLFSNNCSVCHGSDARGAPGFPNLADNDWLYGGDPDTIHTSITNGRSGVMPALGAALGEQGLDEVAAYVYGMNGRVRDSRLQAISEAGEARFATLCAACHGADGTGNPVLGAPDLTDDVWLYGGSFTKIRETVELGRIGRMPAQQDLLSEAERRLLTAYVYGLPREQR